MRNQSQTRLRSYGRAKIRRVLKAKYGDAWPIMRTIMRLVRARPDTDMPRFDSRGPVSSWKAIAGPWALRHGGAAWYWAYASKGERP